MRDKLRVQQKYVNLLNNVGNFTVDHSKRQSLDKSSLRNFKHYIMIF